MTQDDLSLAVTWLKCDGHNRFDTAGRLRDPCVLNEARSLYLEEATVVRPCPSFVFDGVIEEPVDDGVQDHALGTEPRAAGTLRVGPYVEDLLGRRLDGTGDDQINKLQRTSSLRASKNASSWSRRSFQNRS